jgi:hypothetical protein
MQSQNENNPIWVKVTGPHVFDYYMVLIKKDRIYIENAPKGDRFKIHTSKETLTVKRVDSSIFEIVKK